MHQEPLHRFRQLRYEGSRDPVGPRSFVVRHGLPHGVFKVLQGVVLHRPPFLRHPPGNVGPDQPLEGRQVHWPLGVQRLPIPLDSPMTSEASKSTFSDSRTRTDHRPDGA